MHRILSIFFWLLLPLMASAELVAEMEAPPRQIELGELFYLRYIIVTDNKGEVQVKVKAPAGCTEITKTVNTSVMRRGSISAGRTITYDIYYRANRPGRVEVPSATIYVGKAVTTTRSSTIQISGPNKQETDPFLKLELSARNTSVGKPVTATVILYSPYSLAKSTQLSDLKASRCKVVKKPVDTKTPNVQKRNGKQYYVYRLARFLITPNASGKIKIEPGIYRLLLSGKKYSIALAPAADVLNVSPSRGKAPASGDKVNDDAIFI